MQIIMYIIMHIVIKYEKIIYGIAGMMYMHMVIVSRGLTVYIIIIFPIKINIIRKKIKYTGTDKLIL